MKVNKSNIKITVAKPLFAVSESPVRGLPRADGDLLNYRYILRVLV